MIPIYTQIFDTRNCLDIRTKLLVKGLKTSFNLDTEIKDVCIIDGPDFIGPEMDYSSLNNKNVTLMPSFNILDGKKNISQREYYESELQNVIAPDAYNNQSWINFIRLFSNISYKEVCRILNHAACWVNCMEINRPVIILEKGSMLFEEHDFHVPRGSINALGGDSFHIFNTNILCNPSPWAYSIDPVSAKILFEDLVGNGIVNPLPTMMSANKLSIICMKKAHRIRNINISNESLRPSL